MEPKLQMGPHPLTDLCEPQLSLSSGPWTTGSAMCHLELLLPGDTHYKQISSPQCHLLEIYICNLWRHAKLLEEYAVVV